MLRHPGLEHLLRSRATEPVDRRAGVGGEEESLRIAALEQRQRRRLALLVRQEDLEPVAVEADVGTAFEQALDVVEVVGVAGMGDCTRAGSTPSCSKISSCRGPVSLAGREWAMIGLPVCTLARGRPVDLLDVLGQPGLIGGALDERALDLGALDPCSMSETNRSAICRRRA